MNPNHEPSASAESPTELAAEFAERLRDDAIRPDLKLPLPIRGLVYETVGLLQGIAKGVYKTGQEKINANCLRILSELENGRKDEQLSCACLDLILLGTVAGLSVENHDLVGTKAEWRKRT